MKAVRAKEQDAVVESKFAHIELASGACSRGALVRRSTVDGYWEDGWRGVVNLLDLVEIRKVKAAWIEFIAESEVG